MNYRIKEFDNKFTVQCEYEETTGYLWWKKTKIEWHNSNEFGYPVTHLLPWPSMKPFNSLEEAKAKIDSFKKGVIYHNV